MYSKVTSRASASTRVMSAARRCCSPAACTSHCAHATIAAIRPIVTSEVAVAIRPWTAIFMAAPSMDHGHALGPQRLDGIEVQMLEEVRHAPRARVAARRGPAALVFPRDEL